MDITFRNEMNATGRDMESINLRNNLNYFTDLKKSSKTSVG